MANKLQRKALLANRLVRMYNTYANVSEKSPIVPTTTQLGGYYTRFRKQLRRTPMDISIINRLSRSTS